MKDLALLALIAFVILVGLSARSRWSRSFFGGTSRGRSGFNFFIGTGPSGGDNPWDGSFGDLGGGSGGDSGGGSGGGDGGGGGSD